MATTKKRINISVSREVEDALSYLSLRDQVPQATKAEQLLRIALEIEEDIALSVIAQERDTTEINYISHKDAWK